MNDLISRQAAIDAFLTELTKRERKNLLHTWSTVEVKYFVVDMLEKSPSAQPEPYKEGTNNQIIACPMCPDCPDNCPLGEDMRGEQE